MKHFNALPCVFRMIAVSAVLGGCDGTSLTPFVPPAASGTRLTAPQAAQLFARTIPSHLVPAIHPNRKPSWIVPGAKKEELLYASDVYSGTVDVYNYGDPIKVVGRMTGFDFPYGECSDKSGHVFVVDLGAQDIVEYKHGTAKPMRTLSDPSGYPIGCSVDPTTGNLAVSNFDDSGGVVVYQNASGQPTAYSDPEIVEYWSPGYDNEGNLYVEGQNASGSFEFAVLFAGNDTFFDISIDATMFFPGGVMFDGKYMALTDQKYGGYPLTGINEVNLEGSKGIVVRGTQLVDTCASNHYTQVPQPWIEKSLVVGGNLDCQSRFDYWNYMNGGLPVKSITPSIAPVLGYGQTVSR